MINPFAEVQWNPDSAERRKFAKSLIVGFPVLAVVFLSIGWMAKGSWDANLRFSLWLGCSGAAAGSIFWIVPQVARPFYTAWYFLACCIGIVVGNVLLAGFYYLIFSPMAMIRRGMGKRAFRKSFDKAAASYWNDVKPVSDPGRYFRQF